MEENIKDRIIRFQKFTGLGQGKFEATCGISNGTINNIKDGISSPNVSKIASAYPNLDLNWLITGHGEMLKAKASTSETDYPYKYVNELLEENRQLRIKIDKLKKKLNSEKSMVAETDTDASDVA